jgi:hypothetical protein
LRELLDNLKFNRLDLEQINIFFIFSIFLITLSYFCLKAFFGSGEFTDILFVIFMPIICEASTLLFLLNKHENFFKKKSDSIIFILSFIIIFLLWDYNSYIYTKLFSFGFFNLLTLLFFIFLNKINHKYEILIAFIFLTIFNGLFYEIDYLSTKNLFLILLVYSIYFASFKFSFRINKAINIILSLLFFFILLKVFILSSEKDSFHYSFAIGPGYSNFAGHKLLNEIVSQYGYLNILFAKFFSNFSNNRIDYGIVLSIVFLLIIFLKLLIKKVGKITDYPTFIIVLFSSILLFANLGNEKLAGSILIPSSSVFRFLPSLIVMLFFSKIIFFKNSISLKKNTHLFFLFLVVGSLWSFESFIFILFSLCSLFLFFIFFNILKKNKFFEYIFINHKFIFYYFIFYFFIYLFIIFFTFKNNQFVFFYEYLLNGKSIKNIDIPNDGYVLIFIIFFIFKYIFLRSSFKLESLKFFFNNLIWFTLFVSFSAYYVTRSVYTNLFTLFPFYIYFLLCMRSEFEVLIKIRKLFLNLFILISITVFLLSTYTNKNIFYKNLLSPVFLNIPKYEYNYYKPSFELQTILNNFKDVPVTLYTGKTIHNFNNNFKKGGYGLPILPLEQFNILPLQRKTNLMRSFFKKNNKHLLICLKKCGFYNEDNKMKSWSNIFIPIDFTFTEIKLNSQHDEILYLIEN